MNIDVEKTKVKVEELKKQDRLPKIAMFGGSVFLFPHPVKELADFLKSYDIHINYDAAHVAGLIAGGQVSGSVKRGCRYHDNEYAQDIIWSTGWTCFGI